jgi:uncharacterized protein YbjT (DUF2867 family)
MKKTVLVAGATGQQGGAVARRLIERGHMVKALTRNPESERAKELERLGMEPVKGDFHDRASLVEAMRGCDTVFAMASPLERGVEAETEMAITTFEAALEAGVSHYVYSSVAGADKNTGIPHFESKFKVEQYITSKNIPYTIVAPVYFMENLRSPFSLPALQQGVFSQALPKTRKLQMIALQNIAEFVVHIIENPDKFNGKRFEIASDDLSGEEVAEILTKTTECPIGYNELELEQLKSMNLDLGLMYEWFNEVGYSVDLEELKRDYPDVSWKSLRQWTEERDWSDIKCD